MSIVFARHSRTLGETAAALHTIRKHVRLKVELGVIRFSIGVIYL